MRDTVHQIIQRTEMVTHMLGRIGWEEVKPMLEHSITQLQLIADLARSASQVETKQNEAFLQQIFSDLARCKQKLSAVSHELDQLKSQAAERYRAELGDDKQEFEKLSQILQQQTNAEGFRFKRIFEDLRECLRENDHLMSDLMDLKSSIEHERFARLGIPTGDGAIVHPDTDHGDTPCLSP